MPLAGFTLVAARPSPKGTTVDTSFLIIYPLQFFYALGAVLFFVLIPLVLLVPEDRFPRKWIFPTWIALSAVIAFFTSTNPPENPDPLACQETRQGFRCE